MVMLCDRYPQNQVMGFNDGRLLHLWSGHRTRLLRAMARWESIPYRWAEADPPEVLRRTAELSQAAEHESGTFADRFDSFIDDPWLNALHVGLLHSTGSRELSFHVVEPLIERALSLGVDRLTKREATLVLSDARAMELLHRRRSHAISAVSAA